MSGARIRPLTRRVRPTNNSGRVQPLATADERAFTVSITNKRVLLGERTYPFAGLNVQSGITLSSARYQVDGGGWSAITTGSYTDLIQAIRFLSVEVTEYNTYYYELELTDVDANVVTEDCKLICEVQSGSSKRVEADKAFRPFSDYSIAKDGSLVDAIEYSVAGATTVALTTIPRIPLFTGTHTGGNNEATLTDSAKGDLTQYYMRVGRDIVYNDTDGSSGTITDVATNTLTATLSGGTDNDWDTNDAYTVRSGDYLNTVARNFSLTLSNEGYHRITLTVTDTSANTSSASIMVNVNG